LLHNHKMLLMKYIFFALLSIITHTAFSQNKNIITQDVANFWNAYDKIIKEKDSSLQYKYINDFISNGTPGLHAIMEARDYDAKSYLDAIKNYPAFWNSIRQNTSRVNEFAREIESGIDKLKIIYPGLKPAKIYFTIGCLRTPGTTMNGMVLIGSELAMADKHTVTDEFPEQLSHLKTYFAGEPVKEMAFLNVHEYVHAQQKTSIGHNLLAQCIIEGAAEFLAVKATGIKSPTPSVGFGKANSKRIKEAFTKEIYSPLFNNWLWNNTNNPFSMRDLGYYVGYAICEKYYEKAADKKKAISKIIELNYNNDKDLQAFADQSGYFDQPVRLLKKRYEASRPTVISISEFLNGGKNIDPNLKTLTAVFSQKMDKGFRNLILGPLGEKNLLPGVSVAGFSDDGKSITYGIDLKPGTHYQIVLNYQFRSVEGFPLIPYLVDFTTAANIIN
jgi:hypothetical protein